jgi:hypothetical protein
MTWAILDDVDLRHAMAELARGREELRLAHEIDDRTARMASIRVALDKLALASRMIDDVVSRREP